MGKQHSILLEMAPKFMRADSSLLNYITEADVHEWGLVVNYSGTLFLSEATCPRAVRYFRTRNLMRVVKARRLKALNSGNCGESMLLFTMVGF